MDPIDGELRRALAVEPSPEFLVRVRTRVAEEPEPAGRGIRWIAVAPLLAAAALLAMIAIVRRPVTPGSPTADVLIARIAVAPVGVLPAAAARAEVGHEAPPSAVRVEPAIARHRDARRPEPEVLIAAGEMQALRQLIRGVRAGQIDLSRAVAATPVEAGEGEPLVAIEIPPLAITPLGGEEGARP